MNIFNSFVFEGQSGRVKNSKQLLIILILLPDVGFSVKIMYICWKIAKRKSDGHLIYRVGDDIYSLLIEIDYTHATSQKKLMDIYQSGEVQEWYKNNYNADNYFPSFLIVSLLGDTKYENVPFTYNTLDFEFNDIEQVLGLK